ncbi:MAG: tetratricopeptide repeat protein, partial [Candidatus Hydrogenedentes bacterium]|nr:tetratricopeptide repeat protein [Candidatus Hydrogenedentota bacterium]
TAYLGLLNRFSGHRSFAQRVRTLIPQIDDEKHRVDALCRLARYMPDWAGKIAVEVAAVGDIFRQKKEYDQAEDIYMQALILSPTDLGYQVKLADILLARGELAAALGHYRLVLLTAPESPYSAGQFDRVCMEQGEPDEAARFWEGLHEMNPKAAVPALHLGYVLERKDRIEEALILYRQIEEHHPNNAEALLRQGILLAILEGYAKGRVVMDRALDRAPDLHPDLVAGLTRIAAYYTETGAHAFAEAIYREVMELAPDNGWHQVRYAEALMAQENYSKAQEVFVDILQGAPESPYSADKLDEIFERIEEPALRVSTWKSLYTRYPEAFIPVLHYGKALEDKGDHNEALLQYRILHDSHPDQPELMLRLGMLTARIEGYDTGRLLMDGAVAAEQSL